MPLFAIPRPRVDGGPPGRGWRALVAVAAGFALLALLEFTAALTLPLVCAGLLFALLSRPAEALERRGWPAAAAAALLVFAPGAAIGVLAGWWAAAALAWWHRAGAALTALAQRALADGAAGVGSTGGLDGTAGMGSASAAAARWALARLGSIDADVAAWLGRETLPAALRIATVGMLVFFMLIAQRSVLAGLLRALGGQGDPAGALGRRRQVLLLAALRDARAGVSTWLATMGLVNLGLGVATAAVLAALGQAPGIESIAWAGAITLLLFVPYLGPLAITALLATTGTAHGAAAWLAPAVFLGLHAVEANLVSPLAMGRSLRMGRPALLVAVIVGAWVWGIGGAVLAVPILIVARAALRRGRSGSPARSVALAFLAGESRRAASLDASARAAVVAEVAVPVTVAGEPQVRGMPVDTSSPAPCASPTSPKPIRPRSTVSR